MEWVGPLAGSISVGGFMLLMVLGIRKAWRRPKDTDADGYYTTTTGRKLPKNPTRW